MREVERWSNGAARWRDDGGGDACVRVGGVDARVWCVVTGGGWCGEAEAAALSGSTCVAMGMLLRCGQDKDPCGSLLAEVLLRKLLRAYYL